MGSKWSRSTCLCTPNSPRVSLEEHILDPFLTHFLVAKEPIFKAFCDFGVAKMACNGLKKGSFHLFRHTKWSQIMFGKTHFRPIFDPLFVPNQPNFKTLEGPKWLAMGSKWAHFTCLGTPNGPRSCLEKHSFDPFLTHFLSQTSPISRLWRGQNGLQWAQNGLISLV